MNDHNESDALDDGAVFVPVGWELARAGMGRPQDLINRMVRQCDYFVLLLHDRGDLRHQLQETVTLIRSVGDVQRLFVCNWRHSIALRATAERVALATWLVHELDRPADALAAGGAPHEFRLTNDRENVVRVFYLARPESGEALQKAASQVPDATGVRRLFVYDRAGGTGRAGVRSAMSGGREGHRGQQGR